MIFHLDSNKQHFFFYVDRLMTTRDDQFLRIQYLFLSKWINNQGLNARTKKSLKVFLGTLCDDTREIDIFVGGVIQNVANVGFDGVASIHRASVHSHGDP